MLSGFGEPDSRDKHLKELCDCSNVIQVKVVPPLPGSLKAACSMWLEIPGRNISALEMPTVAGGT